MKTTRQTRDSVAIGATSDFASNVSEHPYRRHLLGGVCVLAICMGFGSGVHAQDGPVLEEIQVTGTRIIRSGMNTPTPVTSVDAQELANMAPGNLIEALSQLPQFYGNIEADQITGGQNSGSTNVNLRGAGVNRTLVLLDGRRVVSSNRFGTVDVGMFPKELIRNIETVTGGASASYGTDAVAGVVNFLLDTEFTGIKGHVQGGETTIGDGENFEGGLAFGTDIGERMHVLVSGEYFHQKAINSPKSVDKRDYRQRAVILNPDGGTPTFVVRDYVSPGNFTHGGIIVQPGSALNGLAFQPDGSVVQMNVNENCNCILSPVPNNLADRDTEIAPAYSRGNLFGYLDYDLSDNVNVYVQGIYGKTRNSDRRESIALVPSLWGAPIFADNAFLPESVSSIMDAEDLESFTLGYLGLNTDDNLLGDSRQITDNRMYSITTGFNADVGGDGFMSGWRVDGYYQYGKNRQDFITENGIRVDRLFIAMDAVADPDTGVPVCRAALFNDVFADCVPVNLFGGNQNISPEAASYIVDDGKTSRQLTSQHFAELVMTGEIWEGFGAGPISGAFGGSYRKESLNQFTMDPSDEYPALPDGTLLEDLPGNIQPPGMRGIYPENDPSLPPGYTGIVGLRGMPLGFTGDRNSSTVLFSSLRTIAGGYNVKELFGEVNVPILSGMAFAENLAFTGALRWADYSGSGSVWAWKVGLDWQIVQDFRLRATQSRDTRAATLRERFDQTRGGAAGFDPVLGHNFQAASFSGGNPNVDPEKADTITIGAVWQPSFFDGFSASLDWYYIDISDAIGQLTAQNVVDGCAGGDQTLCQYVIRDAVTNEIAQVDALYINLANQRIKGADLELTYNTGVRLFGGGAEMLNWRFFGTWLGENSIKNPDAPRDERAGQVATDANIAFPKYKFTTNLTYSNGPITIFLQERYLDGGLLDRTKEEGVTIDDNSVPSRFYTDLNFSYSLGEENQLTFYTNVTNLFDKAPPPTPGIISRVGTIDYTSPVYDTLGRRFVAGIRFRY